MRRPLRILTVTAGLMLAGALAGASIAAVAAAALVLVLGGPGELLPSLEIYAFAAPVGAALGMLVGPCLAWGLLRRVAIGRAIMSVAGGALGGALVGLACPWPPAAWLWCSLGGAAAAALWVRRHAPEPDGVLSARAGLDDPRLRR